MRNRALLSLSLASVGFALTAGCSGTAPTITITDAFVTERTEAGTVVHVVVRAVNPTKEAIPMWAIAYSGSEGGKSGGSVERWTQATAPAGGAVAFELPVVVRGPESGVSPLVVSGKIEYVPGGRLRELLSELDYPLPDTSFSESVNVDWSAPPRPPVVLRTGTVRTALILDPGPVRAADTLPPLKKPQ